MSKLSKSSIASIFSIIIVSVLTSNNSYSELLNDETFSSIEVTKIGLELTKISIEQGNIENAQKYSDFTTQFFGKNVQNVRLYNTNFADEIHISLLDINTDLKNSNNGEILTKITNLQNLINQIEIDRDETRKTIVNMLSIADEQYQNNILNNDDVSYQISKSLIEKSSNLFETHADLDENTKLELRSFLAELKQDVQNKEDFVAIGKLITIIQRDLIGNNTENYDQKELYDKIKDMYTKLLAAVDSGDYESAESYAIEAYLENFEYLEPQIKKVDPNLLNTLEENMHEKLRDMIKNRQSPQDIKIFLEQSILPDLAKAEKLENERLSSNQSTEIEAMAISNKGLKTIGEATEEQKSEVRNKMDFIRETLQVMLNYYKDGDYQAAYSAARTAYLDSYESVEIPLREIDPDFTLEVEYQFAELRNLIKEQADFEDIEHITVEIKRNLDESERLVSGTGTLAPTIAFSSSFAIIFREGLESVLILGAIITYLEASRNTKFKPFVYYGIIAAIGVTAITWFVASYIVTISGANRNLIEAIAALSATAVLFYVSFWVLNKIEHKKWMEFVKAKVWQATTTGSVIVFVMLSFFTVYREGFETVLFYQAMFGFAKYMESFVGLGFVLGLLSLLGVYYGMRRLGRKLPLRMLFGLTMGTGAYLSIAFLGNAVRELQTLDLIQYTSMLGIIPRFDITLAKMTGIYPTLETLVAQIILLGVYLVATSYVLFLRPRKEKQIAALRKSRKMDHD